MCVAISSSPHHARSDNSESEYFSETLAAESLPHYQAPIKDSPSPTSSSPYSSPVEAANHVNNNGQHFQQPLPAATQKNNMINNNQKYPQPPTYNNNNMHTNGNGNGQPPLVRNNVVMSASIPAGGVSASSQMQQALQQKYYDQYENFAKPNQSATPNSVNGNGMNNNHQNGMSQSAYNGTKAYASHPQQMTSSYNQQMAYNNHYNQNGPGIGKIADYDPLTDGPRNMPPASRPNQTLIYSSERTNAQRESSDSFFIRFVSLFFVLFAHQITFVMLVCKISC